MSNTIAAIATPHAVGGISVIRVSGDEAIAVCDRCFRAVSGQPLSALAGYRAAYGKVVDQDRLIDEAVALVFRAPKSYTGEDVVEISCHGGIYITKEVLRVLIQCGAQPAAPGEFTKRAFLNGKLSLTQAESVMDVIASQGKQTAQAALAGMEGNLYRKITAVKDSLLSIAGHLSAWADYPEEEIPVVEHDRLLSSLKEVEREINELLAGFDRGRLVRAGINTVIVGKPNVGKSTLMNLLAGCQRSIVTEIAGTTRDVIEDTVDIGGVVLNLADTAGIHQTDDIVEQAGVALSVQRLKTADLVLALFDHSSVLTEEDLAFIEQLEGQNVIAVVNKTDLEQRVDTDRLKQYFKHIVYISAKKSEGINDLNSTILELLKIADFDPFAPMLANERQRSAAQQASTYLAEAIGGLSTGFTLDAVTISIESAIESLLALTGERVTDRVVDEVFSHFCVGK
ncbi:MAG: tRNA uridine-5-carboxymethylaminomethyl(34) synthesis GTPase MnmE [Clostridiales bacterium]|nr:tRNA uridine-5-carboxymethylaminomethyl(34) synthesis GTPase MnmE [Clostridiales bacterium]